MPTVPRNWADPFLEQAREDLAAAWSIVPSKACASTLCMLLQMVFEKLAKAAYTRAGNVPPKSHQVASLLFLVLQRYPTGKALLGANLNVQQFVADLEKTHIQLLREGSHLPGLNLSTLGKMWEPEQYCILLQIYILYDGFGTQRTE